METCSMGKHLDYVGIKFCIKWFVSTHLEIGGWLRIAPTTSWLVKKITKYIEEKKYRQQVQKWEESFIVMQRTIVCDYFTGEKCYADDDQQERIQTGTGDEQTRPEIRWN